MPAKKIKIAIIGCGSRGTCYANYAAQHPESLEVVAIAEPRNHYRNVMAKRFDIPDELAVEDWSELAEMPKLADAAIIATSDALHTEPAIAFADKKYDILLEKPMAPTEQECRDILDASKRNNVLLAVCHVMIYTKYTQKVKELLDSGAVGDIVTMQHLESVGYWHQAHSFVRGNWRNSIESSPMLLAKSCHDIDWIRYIMNRPCAKVSSFGNLKHFRASEKPEGASARCVSCDIESKCPYSAIKIYLKDRAEKGNFGWPVDIIAETPTIQSVREALEHGPYGRCVYDCDNDVVDHQVVNMLFEDGATCAFTMTAFTPGGQGRKTVICGTKGQLTGNGREIEVFDFETDETTHFDLEKTTSDINDGHGGGDSGIMKAFVSAVADNDAAKLYSTCDTAYESHQIVFAAERSRLSESVVSI